MRVRLVSLFEIDLCVVVSLFLLWIALPRLVRLSMGALIGLLSGIVFGGLFAHRAFLRLYINKSSDRGCGSRGRNETTIVVLVIIICSVGVCDG